ncbi:YdeI/OmpD-associated family protein [Candidatus Woesearchaeota archaeon]|nr:YdeI/OmpD-associated family protein [Candidatus Woesearchaeota archaeon]
MIPRLTVRTRRQLHLWFVKNHEKESKVFLISWKRHTGKPFLTHRAQMEEAICWGWIDTTLKRIDEDRYGRYFVKRGPKGKWSTNTMGYAKQLIMGKRMQPSGLRAYKRGLQQPIADSTLGKTATMPSELKKALAKDSLAKKNFELYPPSTKKIFYRWIAQAKRSETKEKRLEKTLELARKKQKLF